MQEKDTGGPAFPTENHDGYTAGMTLRDYFAAKAMQSIMRDAVLPTKADREEHLPPMAQVAYEVAEAMLKARDL